MPKASDLKRGMLIDINGAPHVVKHIDVKSPSSRGAATLYKVRYNNMQSGQKLDESYKGDDFLREADCQRVAVQYSYHDGSHYVFMNLEDYSQYELNGEDLEEQAAYLSEGLEGITALLQDGKVLSIELPQSLVFTIAETAPGIKGASASARTKPATTDSGLVVQVPEYLEPGEQIKVNTQTGKFMSRA